VKAIYLVRAGGVDGRHERRHRAASDPPDRRVRDGEGTTGAATVVATNLVTACIGVDTSPTLPGQVYVLALTVGSGSAGSTVGFVRLAALVV
jgi:hypothetical protein